jgi:pSer/pThr/pTyr-binding forkhead associated (FHA) protein/outer membrane biosynthesis protein TonB
MMQTQLAQKEIYEGAGKEVSFQFRVFKDKEYLRLNGFSQQKITIGRSPKADLVLDHGSVAEFHADVAHAGGRFFLTNYKPNNGLRVNGRSIKKVRLKDKDVIDIGPFSMVFKPRLVVATGGGDAGSPAVEQRSDAPELYAVVVKNDYPNSQVRQTIANRLGIVFRKSPEKMEPLLKSPEQVVKKNMTHANAHRMQQIFEMAGAESELVPMHTLLKVVPETQKPEAREAKLGSVPEEKIAPAREEKSKVVPADRKDVTPEIKGRSFVFVPDEDEEDDLPANFRLKEKLVVSKGRATGTIAGAVPASAQLEVIKSIGERAVDVQFVGAGRRYQTDVDNKRLRLAQLAKNDQGFVLLPEAWNGTFLSGGKSSDLRTYKTETYLHSKRKRLYRIPLAAGDTVVMADGYCEYRVRHTRCMESPYVKVEARERAITWRHWSVSGGFHFLMLLVACIIFAISSRVPEEETLHFVKVDMSQFQETPEVEEAPKETPKETPKAPEPEPEPVKAEPVKPTEEPQKVIPKEIPKTTTAKKTEIARTTPKVSGGSEDAATNSHPDAGGGFGEGNIANRNINQTGLLSLLGDAPDSGSSSAGTVIAEVTNLDAVEVPGGTTENQFSVGGIKGSLGNGKLAVAGGEVVKTKGSSQVLRSAGVEGPGTVAALERGEIGNKQVKGMVTGTVTAKMSKSVAIQGGMSREAVKKVIDQHLEEIQYCYESALLENEAVMGRIVFEWTILLSGKVGEVRIESSSVNSHLIHDCIKEAIKSWTFPKPTGSEVVVSYPFVFDVVGF